jgi:glycosyltransferase involved in cell wall biosynthesis
MRRKGEPRSEQWRGANIYRLPISRDRAGMIRYVLDYGLFFAGAFATVAALDVRRRYDVVQVNTMPDVLVFVALVPKLRGAKVVLDFHELMAELLTASFTGRRARWVGALLKSAERAAARFADRVLVANPVQLPVLVERTGIRELTLIHNVPEEETFSPELQGSNGAADIEPPVVLTHGTLVERYGVQVLLHAVPQILKRRDVKFVVVGEGQHLGELRAIAAELGLGDSVQFTGRLTPADVARRIRQATLGVVPILEHGYLETVTPNKLFEYVALRLPVVASDTVGVRAYFDDEAVRFVRPGDSSALADAILSLLDSPARRQALASNATAVYETVRWERSKEEYTAVFRPLMRGSNSTAAGS